MTTGARRHHRYTYTEYLILEEGSSVRHEFLDGEIYAMAGGTPTHAALAATVIGLLAAQLPADRRAYTSDLRIRVPETGFSTYPDVTVVCGPTTRAVDDPLAVTNPILIVEVTSHSTEEYDRGEKLTHYQRRSSVQEVLIVSHHRPEVVLHRREASGTWTSSTAHGTEPLQLTSIGVTLAVEDVYRAGLEDQG
jgi:Uma2 family endonuclease